MSWGEFEENTKIALEAIGYKVERNVSIDGNQIDLFAKKIEPLVTHRFLVECKNHNSNISVNQIRLFSEIVSCITTREKPCSGLYVASNGFTKEAKIFANKVNVTLITLADLFDMSLSSSQIVNRIIQKFEEDDLSQKYIALSCQVAEHSSGTIYKPVDKFIDNFLHTTKRTGAIILGNFGTGKTSFSKHYSYSLAKRFLQSSNENVFSGLPIYINLRDVDNLFRMKGLLLNIINNTYNGNASSEGLDYWLHNKSTLIILDGFDEMASKMDKMVISNNINYLFGFLSEYPKIKLLLTCRTHFFKTQLEENLFKDILKLYIRDWGTDELKEYIKLANPGKDQNIIDTIQNTYNLEELSKTPIFLDMISKTIEELGGSVNKSKLYKIYTDQWIENQDYRSHLSPEQKIKIMEELAFHFFSQNISSIHHENIPSILKTHFPIEYYPALKNFDNDVRTCSFLVRTENGDYHFVHRSFLEYFVSLKLADEVKKNDFKNFSIKNLTIVITSFFSDYFEDDAELILKNILRNNDEVVRANFTLAAGFLKFSDNLLKTLLSAIQLDENNDVKYNAINSLSNLRNPNSTKELIKISYQDNNIGRYALKALSSHCDSINVVERFEELLNIENDDEKITISLDALSPIKNTKTDTILLNFIKKKWWFNNEKVIYSYLNLILDRQNLDLAIVVESLYKVKNKNLKLDLFIKSSMEELSKRFMSDIIIIAQRNKHQGLSIIENKNNISNQFKFLSKNQYIQDRIKNLYTKKVTIKK